MDDLFYVLAGTWDGNEINCKYTSDGYETLEAAIVDYDDHSGYAWAYIQYKDRTISVMSHDFDLFS